MAAGSREIALLRNSVSCWPGKRSATRQRSTAWVGIRVYLSGRKVIVYRYFTDKSGKHAKFNTIGVYPEMPLISPLEVFESLATCPDVIKVNIITSLFAKQL